MDKNIKQPLVTVLMPVYNGEKYLSEAIESILKQTYSNFEFLIIDDGSTDKSAQIISVFKSKDRRIRVITHKRNKGLGDSLNEGISRSKGEFIARMDADDISLTDRLMEQVKIMLRQKNISLVGTRYAVIDQKGQFVRVEQSLLSNELLKKVILFRSPFCHGSVMIRKHLLTLEKYSLQKKHFEDYDLWARLSRITDFSITSSVQYLWRSSSKNVTVVHSEEMFRGSKSVSRSLQEKYLPGKVTLSEVFKIINDSEGYKNTALVQKNTIPDRGQHGYQLLIANLALLNMKKKHPMNFLMLIFALILINPLRPILWCFELLDNRRTV